MNCKVCNRKGMIPKCPFCGRKPLHSKKKPKLQRIKDAAEKRDQLLNELAFHNFQKSNSEGSGHEPFDEQVKRAVGDWKQ